MTHFPTHLRRAFVEWVHDGCPDQATVEERYEPVKWTADELLRRFINDGCTDVMPKETVATVVDALGASDLFETYRRSSVGLTYGVAAGALLLQRVIDDDAAQAFLVRVLGLEDEQ